MNYGSIWSSPAHKVSNNGVVFLIKHDLKIRLSSMEAKGRYVACGGTLKMQLNKLGSSEIGRNENRVEMHK